MFFDPRRYDLAKVGRYKFNKKLMLRTVLQDTAWQRMLLDPSTGEILAEAGVRLQKNWLTLFRTQQFHMYIGETEEKERKSSFQYDGRSHKFVDVDPEEVGVTEQYTIRYLQKSWRRRGDIDELKDAIKRDIHDLIPKHITKEDILASINYNMHLEYGIGTMMISTTWVTDVSVL